MFNPFKRKDNEFKLDDYSLPTLGDTHLSNDSKEKSFDDMGISSDSSFNFGSNSSSHEFNSGNSFGGASESSFHTNSFSTSSPKSSNNSLNDIQSVNSDIIKAKLETLESKTTLIDARLANMEQKLELLNQLILAEVSDETKQKLNVQSMMNKIRK